MFSVSGFKIFVIQILSKPDSSIIILMLNKNNLLIYINSVLPSIVHRHGSEGILFLFLLGFALLRLFGFSSRFFFLLKLKNIFQEYFKRIITFSFSARSFSRFARSSICFLRISFRASIFSTRSFSSASSFLR